MENHQQRKETNMKKILMTTAILAIVPVMAVATPAFPPGAKSLDCDITKFKPVMSTLVPGKILYWNNPTCVVPEDGPEIEEEEELAES